MFDKILRLIIKHIIEFSFENMTTFFNTILTDNFVQKVIEQVDE